MTERTDPVDGFIDAVIAWENLFGGSTEMTLRVSTAMARLLKQDAPSRLQLQKEIAELYGKRSGVVHGKKPLKWEKALALRDRATELAADSLRKLYESRRELLGVDRREMLLLLDDGSGDEDAGE